MFTIGTIVKCKDEANTENLSFGKSYTVITPAPKKPGMIRIVNDSGEEHVYYAARFELASGSATAATPSTASVDSAVAALLATANSGLTAIRTLLEMSDKFKILDSEGDTVEGDFSNLDVESAVECRLAATTPKLKFAAYNLSGVGTVALKRGVSGEALITFGTKAFKAKDVLKNFSALVDGQGSSGGFVASRKGIPLNLDGATDVTIPWNEAETLVSKLVAAGIAA